MKFSITLKSSNKKTGPCVVIRSSQDTCPITCPFRDGGCYGRALPYIKYRWDAMPDTGLTFGQLLDQLRELPIETIIRYGEVGDLPGDGRKIDAEKLRQLNQVATDHRLAMWTYTHYHTTSYGSENLALIREINKDTNYFTINLSTEGVIASPGDDPITTVLPSDIGLKDRDIIACPAALSDKITCSTCRNGSPLCWRKKRPIIYFSAHGSQKRKVNTFIEGEL